MHFYAIAIGSNRRHGRHGAPAGVIAAATAEMESDGLRIVNASPIVETAPIGLTGRRFANSVTVVETLLKPLEVLEYLKTLERRFGRRRGRRWDSRVLDLDIALWSGGRVRTRALVVPHPALARRRFVLDPLVTIAPRWRAAPGATVAHLHARLTRSMPIHRSRGRSGP